MKYTLKIKPYGENEKGNLIKEFTEEEWDLIVDLHERLIRNFKETYHDVKFKDLSHDKEIITMVFTKKKEMEEEELEEYIETLCGYNMENTIFFDDEAYFIRGEIVLDDDIKEKKITALDKFNKLTEDFAPELIDN